jgi:ubiquinone/menaquinone biosynthesis C-methylase UbiE
MKLNVSQSELRAAFAPAVRRRVLGDDPEWDAAIKRVSKRKRGWRHLLTRILSLRLRNTGAVKGTYEEKWASDEMRASRLDLTHGKPEPMLWNNERYLAHPRGVKRVHLHYLMRLIEELQPKKVLEVGFGSGQNLFILASRFPEIAFTGVELTEGGFRAADAVRSQPVLPQGMVEFSPMPPRDLTAHRSVTLQVGTAADLPFADRAFDLVFTVQALEQMESIRARALSEIARVCSGHVAMLEPFADWNTTEMRSARIESYGYFAAKIDDLPNYGLQPVLSTGDMPSKAVYAIGLVVARPT